MTTSESVTRRVLVCGSRSWTDVGMIEDFIGSLHEDSAIIEGGSAGADRIAAEAAKKFGLALEEYPADWKQHGRSAGPIRNQQMLEEGRPDVVVAFSVTPITPGTADMIARARRAGVRVDLRHPQRTRRDQL